MAVGIDIVEVARVDALISAPQSGFVSRWFTEHEIEYCATKAHPARHFAARLAAKEAVLKALALKLEAPPWKEIEIWTPDGAPPTVRLHGELERTSEHLAAEVEISLSHCRDYATAVVHIATTQGPDEG